MIDIINTILQEYSYMHDDKLIYENLRFYKHTNKSIASYFLINCIDCIGFEKDGDRMKEALAKLEHDYVSSTINERKSIKLEIQNSFSNIQEASQLDKNTSAIFLLKFSDISNLNLHRNLVYAIEESPNYFKRYILPYTQVQVDALNKIVIDYSPRRMNEILSDIANDEDEYYQLMENRNIGSVYELVIRLFSKIPFLQYRFSAGVMPKPIEEEVMLKAKENRLIDYHSLIMSGEYTLDNLLEFESATIISADKLKKEIDALLGGESGVL